jgi:RNA polymerase sigma factor (TIGR02999 family)
MTEHPPESDARPAASEPISFEAVYERLKQLAHRQLARGSQGTLDTTALVHEVYLRMSSVGGLAFEHSGQFFVYAARAMRHLLINRARDRMRQKAGGDWVRVTLEGNADPGLAIASAEQALAIEEALDRLEKTDPRAARVFELRFFAGLAPQQLAELLNVTRRTIDRDWRYARAFLLAELE